MTESAHPDRANAASDGDVTTTWRALWAETSETISDRQHARWMCEVASSTEADHFLQSLDEAPTVRMVSHLDAMIARYLAGEPLQYVLGRWAFRRLDLVVDHRVLIPRPETELVVEAALAIARGLDGGRTIVDLGTGSGAIGLALADELPSNGTSIWLTDASSEALDVARANLAGIGRAAQNVRIAHGSWFDALPANVIADLIVSNPPYVADASPDLEQIVGEWEPGSALFAGPDGLDDIRIIIDGAWSRLRPGGCLILEIGHDQGRPVEQLLTAKGYTDLQIRKDLSDLDRIAVARRP